MKERPALKPQHKPRLSANQYAEHANFLAELFARSTLRQIADATGIEHATLRQVKLRMKAGEKTMELLKGCGL